MTDLNFHLKADTEKADFGRFIIEPLEQGYGQTLGNSLRRVLLASLPGVAICAVKISGAKHQFTTITGLKEDISELVLNIKKIRLMMSDEGPVTLKLVKNGPGEVTAGDLEVPAGVSIVNPDLVLGTLSDKKSVMEMELTADRGYGYVTANEREVSEIGVMPVDSLYSPVARVNYRVEATRVGRMTNLDRLVMEVWTDGSMKPSDAIKQAAKILVQYFVQIYEPKAQNMTESVAVTPSVSDEVLKMRIEELDIPTRIVNALTNGGIETVGQLLGTPRTDLMKIKNLGGKSLTIVEEKLREKGVALSV